ncbi:hypothetical protein AAGS61_02190 [Lysinibacillus sp. KU-BSD001]|uniref:hypothetical protein n=1 Tax=Lysinibacillus sp. KU-BSD001 TaxID=3141328 RepID=UPI0036E6FC85
MGYDKKRIVKYFKEEIFDCYEMEPDKAGDIYRKVVLGDMSYEDAWDEINKIMGALSSYRKQVLKDHNEKPLINWEKVVHRGVEISTLQPGEKESVIGELKEAFSEKIYDLVWSQDEVKQFIRLQYDILQLSKLFLIQFPERAAELLELEMDKQGRMGRYEVREFLMNNVQVGE